MIINTDPTKSELMHAWDALDCSGYNFSSKKAFVKHMHSDELHYLPVILSNGSAVEALIWFDSYDEYAKTCRIHYITSREIINPVALAREARRVLGDILANGDIDVLFGFIPDSRPQAVRAAIAFGFRVFAISKRMTYLSKTS